MRTLRRLLSYVRPHMAALTVAYVCMIVLAVTGAVYALLAGPLIKFVFSGNLNDMIYDAKGQLRTGWDMLPSSWIDALGHLGDAIWFVPSLIIVSTLLQGIAQTGQFFLLGRMAQSILVAIRRDAFNAMLRLSPKFYNTTAHGDLLSRLTSDAQEVEKLVFYGLAPLLRDSLAVIALLVLCFVMDVKLALFTFIVVPLAVLPIVRFARWLKRVSKRGQAAQGAINAVCYEALAGIRVVQAFGAEAHEAARLEKAARTYYGEMLVSYFIRAVRTPTMETLGLSALAILLAYLAHQVRTANADPAHFISFFVALVLMYDPLKKLGNTSDYIAAGSAAAERIFEITDLTPDIRDYEGAITLPAFTDAVKFETVSFDYIGTPVLTDVDVTIPKGEMVALVGPSGSGKTTMANLLPRFYDVTKGRVSIDGRDVRDVTLASLRAQVSVVSQDTFLFNNSVEANIAYGSPDATAEQVRAAAKAAYADEFIAKLPQGYATVIGERGITLSGGQRQRLAIARALLRDAPLLVLDEATSALDVESERFVQDALDVLMRGRTSLVIAHRLSTVRRASQICVLKDGVIVERGTHDTLINAGGEYARLYAMQFRDNEAAVAV